MQAAISLGLLTRSAIQPINKCDGRLINARVASSAAALASLAPHQTMIGTKWTVIELNTPTRVVVANIDFQKAAVFIACFRLNSRS